ncbi:MAG: deoxyribose-phosphate aldolase [Elusimicrobiota bacterium]
MDIAQFIDHTDLKPEASESDIINLCKQARKYGFKNVCINPFYVKKASQMLSDANTGVCSVVGFPLGADITSIKIKEAAECLKDGADELDMVINIGAFKSGDSNLVRDEIVQIKKIAKDKILKVIIETGLLSDKEIIKACRIIEESKADFIKTSTGFLGSGPTEQTIRLLKETVKENTAIKASGGINSFKKAVKMIEAGAERIGSSSSVRIMLKE